MRIYLAAPWVDKESARSASMQLEQDGHEISEKWWEHPEVVAYPQVAVGQALEELQQQAAKDIMGVMSADVVVVLQTSKSEGKAVEQGIAIAMGVPIIVVSSSGERGNLFHYLPEDLVKVVGTLGEAQDIMDGMQELD